MSTFQPSQHPDIIFKGIDGNECEEFVAALEDLAYTEGWAEDRRRMLFFARSRLRKAALRWFARLEPSVKNDWDLFVQALFDQYPPAVEPLIPNDDGIATPVRSTTTFSPTLSTATLQTNQLGVPSTEGQISIGASPRTYDASLLRIHFGRLRIVYEDETPPSYVGRGTVPEGVFSKELDYKTRYTPKGVKRATLDRQDALLVSFRADTEAHSIACLDNNHELPDLAVFLMSGCRELHPLVATNGVRTARKVSLFKSGWVPEYQVVSKIWNVLEDGTLQASLLDVLDPITYCNGRLHGDCPSSDWTSTTVHVDTAGMPISFAKGYSTLQRVHPDTNRPLLKARIVFEPL